MSRYYSRDHEWAEIEGDTATIGISDYAQAQLGDITYVEMPELGRALTKGDTAAVVDSVKAAADVYAPLSGTVSAVNAALEGEPELVNTEAELGGWLFRLLLSDAGELAGLMDEAAYADYCKGL